jgi:hypothetical protein
MSIYILSKSWAMVSALWIKSMAACSFPVTRVHKMSDWINHTQGCTSSFFYEKQEDSRIYYKQNYNVCNHTITIWEFDQYH